MKNGKTQSPLPLTRADWAELAAFLAKLQARKLAVPWAEFWDADGAARDRATGFLVALTCAAGRGVLDAGLRREASALLARLRNEPAEIPEQYPAEVRGAG